MTLPRDDTPPASDASGAATHRHSPLPVPPVAALAIRLMEIESTSGTEGTLVDVTAELLVSRRWFVERIEVDEERACILAISGADPVVTLSTHLDTVPPYLPPRLEEDVLHGRGACDAKGIAAAMILAGERLRSRGVSVALLFLVGEETTHDGAHAANARATTSRVLINGEPTESTLAIGTKGALRVTVRTVGRAAHSAYPETGESATRALVAMLSELETMSWPSDPVLGETTVNIGMLAGGVADNVLAPSAEARLMFRLVTPVEELWPHIAAWAEGRATLEAGIMAPPVRLASLPGFATSIARFATDIPALDRWGTPYLFGPGSIHVAHTEHEHVRVPELEEAVDAYERIALAALEREGVAIP